MHLPRILVSVLLWCSGISALAAERPIRALLVTGGCCHDYAHQKTVLTEGISARANVVWSIVHEGDGTTDHRLSLYNDPDWAKNYDVVVHDECFADVKDAAFVRGILKPHRDGLPAVNLHCAMHCYRVDFDHFKEWFEFTGLDTRSHGAQLPIALSYSATGHPILGGLTNWTTGPEELYNNVEVWKTVTPLIYGQQGNDRNMAAWVNDYRGTRVFSTTLGHNTTTVGDPRYLDLVTRGLLWAVNKLDAEHLKPAPVKRKAQKMIKVPVNLALHKKTSASGSQAGHPPEDAVDGNFESRWCAPDNGNNYWFQVDLGKPEEITGVRVAWEQENTAYEYRIAGSNDTERWETLIETKNGPQNQAEGDKFPAKSFRYVRITVTKAPPGSWASFFEFEVLGKELVEKLASDVSDPRLAGVQSPPGFEQTLFAGPPNISYPTCLEATPWGDVFVGVDLNGSLDRERGRGWVTRCRDTDRDGIADAFTTFAKMDSPRGLVFSRNTLFVMHPPVLEAFHDDNADGIADRSDVLVTGLGNDLNFRGADHTCNGVRMGIDGWLYIALGDYGALHAAGKDGSTIQLHGGGILRVRPDGSHLEIVAQGTRNIYDVAIDPFMNLFTCDNTNDGDDWNLRLSHIIDSAHYGYPSLFKHFSEEIMPAMNDFGGGSPTGALFLDEPAFPEDFAHGLYTCQWGWNTVTRHPLRRTGATFEGGKETFLRIPRPTGIASDGLGNLFIASWKGATFNYAGPNAGFVVRVTPLGNEPKPFADLTKQSDTELIKLLASKSATQRLHVQQELLTRPGAQLITPLASVAEDARELSVRCAAVFTLAQMTNAEAAHALKRLAKNNDLRAFALRALTDSRAKTKISSSLFETGLKDANPTVRLQSVLALNRWGVRKSAARILPLMSETDAAISHAAFRALVSLNATNVCFAALNKSDPAAARFALKVLGNLPHTNVVNALIDRLEHPSVLTTNILETLCRLYFQEAQWDGSWWTTRPDTSGPYYQPVTWSGTESIKQALRRQFSQNNSYTTRFLLICLQKYKIELPDVPSSALLTLVKDATLDSGIRKKAFQSIHHHSVREAIDALLDSDGADKLMVELREAFIQDPQHSKNVPALSDIARTGSEAARELAYIILLRIADDTNAPETARALARQPIHSGSDSAILQKLKSRMSNDQTKVAGANPGKQSIRTLAMEEVIKRGTAEPGDAVAGAKLFEAVGCIKCHTVSKDEPPKGPYLGDISSRYSRAEILEAIVRPNAKIAQGFETASIATRDGEVWDGFIVRESGDEIELRNLSGPVVIAKKDVTLRGTRTTSIMPEGLVDHLRPEDVASILRYLESVRTKN